VTADRHAAIEQKWDRQRSEMKLVNPANKHKHSIIVVGSASPALLPRRHWRSWVITFSVSVITIVPRRAHSIATQGGINAAKNYRNDGDSIYRLFHDTVKGGDFRSREANIYCLAQISVNIIDQCVAQGVPFAREYTQMRPSLRSDSLINVSFDW
jgi:succinate dehydrogenase flavoprotein subunit